MEKRGRGEAGPLTWRNRQNDNRDRERRGARRLYPRHVWFPARRSTATQGRAARPPSDAEQRALDRLPPVGPRGQRRWSGPHRTPPHPAHAPCRPGEKVDFSLATAAKTGVLQPIGDRQRAGLANRRMTAAMVCRNSCSRLVIATPLQLGPCSSNQLVIDKTTSRAGQSSSDNGNDAQAL
jgi:hypothetical protein